MAKKLISFKEDWNSANGEESTFKLLIRRARELWDDDDAQEGALSRIKTRRELFFRNREAICKRNAYKFAGKKGREEGDKADGECKFRQHEFHGPSCKCMALNGVQTEGQRRGDQRAWIMIKFSNVHQSASDRLSPIRQAFDCASADYFLF